MGTNITGIGNANAIGFKSRVTGGIYFPPELKDALVGVWSAYGKSNDSTDRNIIKNKIKDRGGDFVISNAAFKLNSGFGEYAADFLDWTSSKDAQKTSFEVKITSSNYKENWVAYKAPNTTFKAMKVRISGIPDGGYLQFFRTTADGGGIKMVNGINEIPAFTNTVVAGFYIDIPLGFDWSNLVIEQIPSFEGAFVTDGIDDLITSTKTVQEMLDGSNEITVVSMIHQIELNKVGTSFTNYCRKVGVGYVRNETRDYGTTGIYGWSISNVNNSNSVNRNLINNILGDKELHSIDSVGDITNSIFSVNGYENASNSPSETSQLAWYWTIIANKVLTTDQINQVIAYFNLDRTLNPDILCNTIKQGITNENHAEFGDKLIDFSGNGRDIQMYNLGWNKESGIDDDGALCLDGVNDFGQFVGDLGLKDYTLIMNRAYNNLINNQVPLISSNIVEDQTPFIVEHWNTGSNAISFSYGASRITDIPLDINKKIVYQSTYSYMGYVIPKGNAISTGGGITLGKFGNGVQYSAICLWSLMLFPYSMSEFLIERQLKKHKLGTLYPDMVEFRPVITINGESGDISYANDKWENINIGDYINIGEIVHILLYRKDIEEISNVKVNGAKFQSIDFDSIYNHWNINIELTSKSPQKINITIDEYIRYEDIVQPYPVLLRFKDENGNEVSWGGKFKVGSTITRIGSAADSNLLPNIYNIFGLLLNGNQVTSSKVIVEKTMVFKAKSAYIFDNKEPKCILSPRLLRIPNSSYKILGHIPDISGHGNHGKINNSAYKLNSGVNGYLVDFTTLKDDGIKGIVRTDSKIYLDKSFNYNQGFWLGRTNNPSPAYKVKVSGIPETGMLTYTGGVWLNLVNGINELPARTNTEEEHGFVIQSPNLDWSNLVIQQIGEYEGAYCLDGVDDFVTIPTLSSGGKQVLMKVNSRKSDCYLYDQRNNWTQYLGIVSTKDFIAYNYSNQRGKTYIDGILNENITANDLIGITHNITVTNNRDDVKQYSPCIGTSFARNSYAQMALYDFMLFDNISTDDKIKELNEYVGIEGNTE